LGRLLQPRTEHYLESEVLFEEPIFVVPGAHHALVRRRKLKFAELAGERWILPRPDTLLGAFIAELFNAGQAHAAPSGIFCNSFKMQLDMVASGDPWPVSPISAALCCPTQADQDIAGGNTN
jgi:DNA-binding transcriptional LysR family regulator